jgi:hypothetical protein
MAATEAPIKEKQEDLGEMGIKVQDAGVSLAKSAARKECPAPELHVEVKETVTKNTVINKAKLIRMRFFKRRWFIDAERVKTIGVLLVQIIASPWIVYSVVWHVLRRTPGRCERCYGRLGPGARRVGNLIACESCARPNQS